MNILQKTSFKKAYKKLYSNQKEDIDRAIRAIIQDPTIGENKVGDLSDVQIYKFQMANQLTLLACAFEESSATLTLLIFGTHENFYRGLKRVKAD